MAETGPDHAIDWPGVGMVKMHSMVRTTCGKYVPQTTLVTNSSYQMVIKQTSDPGFMAVGNI